MLSFPDFTSLHPGYRWLWSVKPCPAQVAWMERSVIQEHP